MSKVKILAASFGGAVASVLGVLAARADDYGFASSTATVSTNLSANIPLVLAIFAGLTALGISVHYIRKWVGRK